MEILFLIGLIVLNGVFAMAEMSVMVAWQCTPLGWVDARMANCLPPPIIAVTIM